MLLWRQFHDITHEEWGKFLKFTGFHITIFHDILTGPFSASFRKAFCWRFLLASHRVSKQMKFQTCESRCWKLINDCEQVPFLFEKSGQCFYLLFSGEISHDPCYLEIPLLKVTASSLDFVKKTPGFSRFVHNFLNTSSLLITQKSFVECRSCVSNDCNLYGWFYVKKSPTCEVWIRIYGA